MLLAAAAGLPIPLVFTDDASAFIPLETGSAGQWTAVLSHILAFQQPEKAPGSAAIALAVAGALWLGHRVAAPAWPLASGVAAGCLPVACAHGAVFPGEVSSADTSLIVLGIAAAWTVGAALLLGLVRLAARLA